MTDYNGLKTCCDGFPPPLPMGWPSCINDGIASFCQPSQADYCKIRCMIWAESSDNPNPKSGVPGGGLGQIKPDQFEKCSKVITNFDKNKPCDQIKCMAYVLCQEKNGSLGKYGTVTRPNSQYQKCMECCE